MAQRRREASQTERKAEVLAVHGSAENYERHKAHQRIERHRRKVREWAEANPSKLKEKAEREARLRNAERRAEQRNARPLAESVVYFIRDSRDGAIKIGWTGQLDVAHRLRSLQCGNPSALEVIATIRGALQPDETALHWRFAKDRVRPDSEWFRPSRQLLDYIATYATPWKNGAEETERGGIPQAAQAGGD